MKICKSVDNGILYELLYLISSYAKEQVLVHDDKISQLQIF